LMVRRSYLIRLICFFQAVDGIRVATVTGVQTCALPIYISLACFAAHPFPRTLVVTWTQRRPTGQVAGSGEWLHVDPSSATLLQRSEERRVGKETAAARSP